jgi:hypothetical protein
MTNRGSISARERELVSTSTCPFLPCRPPNFLIKEYQWAVSMAFIPGIKDDNIHPFPRLVGRYEGESKSKGKIHLTALIAVTVSNFTYPFLHSPLATQCICYIVQLVSVFLRRRSFSAARC